MKRKKYIKPEIERIHVEQTLMDTISVPFDNKGDGIDPDDSEAKPNPGGWNVENFDSAPQWHSLWDEED